MGIHEFRGRMRPPANQFGPMIERLDYVMLLPSVETCVGRVATREGHGFGDEPATRKMHDGFARAEIDARHVLVDPPDRPEQVVGMVLAARERGSLAYRCGPA